MASAFSIDIEAAHKTVRVREQDRGLLGLHTQLPGGPDCFTGLAFRFAFSLSFRQASGLIRATEWQLRIAFHSPFTFKEGGGGVITSAALFLHRPKALLQLPPVTNKLNMNICTYLPLCLANGNWIVRYVWLLLSKFERQLF